MVAHEEEKRTTEDAHNNILRTRAQEHDEKIKVLTAEKEDQASQNEEAQENAGYSALFIDKLQTKIDELVEVGVRTGGSLIQLQAIKNRK